MTAVDDRHTINRQTEHRAAPSHHPSAGSDSLDDHTSLATRTAVVVEGLSSDPGQVTRETPSTTARVGTCSPSATNVLTSPMPAPSRSGPILIDPTLLMAAQVVDDLERTRIANENRLRQMTRDVEDSDGNERGFGLDESHPDVARLAGIVAAIADLEHQAVLGLQRAMRRHPLGPWVKAQKGVGEKQAARLLAAVGDPYWNTLHGRPRTVSELWAYCGLHTLPAGHVRTDTQEARADGDKLRDPGHQSTDAHIHPTQVAARRRKGQRANWSTDAKMRAYLVAVSCMKAPGSPYRDVYLARREHTAATHPEWTPGHSHNDALRITAKAILRGLWVASRDLYEGADA